MYWIKKDVCSKLILQHPESKSLTCRSRSQTLTFMLKFCVNVFEIPIYNKRVCLVGFGMMINIGPKIYSVPPSSMCMTYQSRSQTLIFV